MNKKEKVEVMELAVSEEDLTNVDDSVLFGYGLPHFNPVHVSKKAIARTLRWQAFRMDGTWDAEEIDKLFTIGRKKFIIIG